jgi:hypothetical protein
LRGGDLCFKAFWAGQTDRGVATGAALFRAASNPVPLVVTAAISEEDDASIRLAVLDADEVAAYESCSPPNDAIKFKEEHLESQHIGDRPGDLSNAWHMGAARSSGRQRFRGWSRVGSRVSFDLAGSEPSLKIFITMEDLTCSIAAARSNAASPRSARFLS